MRIKETVHLSMECFMAGGGINKALTDKKGT